jgi:lysophospholipase L1-like esterase
VERAAAHGWNFLDLWDLVPQEQFTDSAIHLTPAGEGLLAEKIAQALRCER